MLSSITPLGERGRHNRWWLTVAALGAGSAVGGAGLGAALGALGAWFPRSPETALAVLAGLGALGLLADLGVAGMHLPTSHRQVDEGWLDRYRGWVYGVGYGVQLGAGVVTVVPSATTYLTWATALLAHSPAAGSAIGATFGVARSLPVLLARPARHPAGLHRLLRLQARWAAPVHRLALCGQVATLAGAILAMMVTA
jgi:hypothetical protein